ncbi:hypothetical protein AOB60_00130 [Streptomyces noursei]|uniref:Uncharacterized protein n=1 Tax=Streptomyces noursei TaxID=1971 RepID=A0A2N8PQU4_STRNR|nr:hypothetical protein AOB60_00130 [Streptomyces noursei]
MHPARGPLDLYTSLRFEVNGVSGTGHDNHPLLGEPGEGVHETLARLKRVIDDIDSQPVQPTTYAWWYPTDKIEICNPGRLNEHIKGKGEPCVAPGCVRKARIEAARAKRRTGITAASVSGVLTRAGFTRAALNWDSTARNDGFDASGEQRNRRVVVMWRGADYRVQELQGELPGIGAFLKRKGYPVRITDSGFSLWVYPRGADEPDEGQPFPAANDKPESSGRKD